MTRCLICLTVLLLLGTRLCAQSVKDTIPPEFSFSTQKLNDTYGNSEYEIAEPPITNSNTTIVSLSCKFYFPSDYKAFPDPIFNEEIYPDTSYVEVTNYENFSVTRTWTAIDTSGNQATYDYIIQYSGSAYQPDVDVYVDKTTGPLEDTIFNSDAEPYTVCVNEEVTFEAFPSNDCSDNVETTWYLDESNIAFAKGEVLTYKWVKPGDYTLRVKANGVVFNGALEKRYKIIVSSGPEIFPSRLNAGQINTVYPTVTFSANTGNSYPVNYELTGSLPTGMSFNADPYLSTPATLSGTPTQAGNFTFTITARGQEKCPGSQVYTLVINKAIQTITFNPLPEKTYGDPPFTLSATASSGLPVTFSIVSGPATVNVNTITLTGPGQVLVRASQVGDANYDAAPNVDRSFTVKAPPKKAQTITFTPVPEKTYGDPAFSLTATASSGLPVTFTRISGPATLDNNNVTITGAGTIIVRASQAGSADYNAAPAVDATIVVKKANQTITFEALPDKVTVDAPFPLTASASSKLPISFDVSGPATISNNMVKLTGDIGKVTIRALQAGSADYNAAPPVERNFNVNRVLAAETDWADELKVYPNPASHVLCVELPEAMRTCKLTLINASGQQVSEQFSTNQKQVKIVVSHIRPGLYLLSINNSRVKLTRKIILR